MARHKRWEQRINEAEERGSFNDDDRNLSGSWVTCACGEQDDIPRENTLRSLEIGKPLDDELAELGYQFHNCVEENLFDQARLTLIAIEHRAMLLSTGAAEPYVAPRTIDDFGGD